MATIDNIFEKVDAHLVAYQDKTIASIKDLRTKANIGYVAQLTDYMATGVDGGGSGSGAAGSGIAPTLGEASIKDVSINSVNYPWLRDWKKFNHYLDTSDFIVPNQDVIYIPENHSDDLDVGEFDTTSFKFPALTVEGKIYNTRIWSSARLNEIESEVVSLLRGRPRQRYAPYTEAASERSLSIHNKMTSLVSVYNKFANENSKRALVHYYQTIFTDYIDKSQVIALNEIFDKDLQWALKTEVDIDKAHVDYCIKYTEIMMRIQMYILGKQIPEQKLLLDVNNIVYETTLEFIQSATNLYMDAVEKNIFAVTEEARLKLEKDKADINKELQKFSTEVSLYSQDNELIDLNNKYHIEDYNLKLSSVLKDSEARMETKVADAKNKIAALAAVADAYVGLINTATQSVVGVVKE